MPLPKKKLIPGILLALMLAAFATPPAWWYTGQDPVITGDPENNHGPANIGQAKHVVKSALDALRTVLPSVTTDIETDLAPIIDLAVPDSLPADWAEKNRAPLLIGQLKAIAHPFYEHLHAAAPDWLNDQRVANGTDSGGIFPWTDHDTDDQNRAMANIGQLKSVFSLRFTQDSDGDGLPDLWEMHYGFDPINSSDAYTDHDGDGVLNLLEFLLGTDPTVTDSRVNRMSVGNTHAALLDMDGQVWTWGRNNLGQLGDSRTTDRWFPQIVPGLAPVIQLSAGYDSIYALLANGTVKAWGSNGSGRLGLGSGTATTQPVPMTVHGMPIVRQVAGGGNHALALDENGRVWSWGAGIAGQLGLGNTNNQWLPVEISGFENVVQIAAGYEFSGAIKEGGTVWTWGSNLYGKLGRSGSANTPTQVGSISGVIRLSLGYHHALALRGDGTVWSWGSNIKGQLGNGTTINSANPVQVTGLTDIVWIEAGQHHSFALARNGILYAWGQNATGQLGDGTTNDSNVAVEVGESIWTKKSIGIAAGGENSIGATSDGRVWSWGRNNYGQLGNGSVTDTADPVEVVIIALGPKVSIPQLSHSSGHYPHSITVTANATPITSVLHYTMDGSEPDVNSDLWPSNEGVQVTLSTILKVRAFEIGKLPSQIKTVSYRIGSSVSAGASHSSALDGTGRVWTWGRNNVGQLGDGTSVDKWFPQIVHDLAPVIQLSAGYNSTYALMADGKVKAWGANASWRLGDSTTTDRFTPVPVHVLESIRQVAGGDSHALALDEFGDVWSWGAGSSGRLGHGDTLARHTPEKINGFGGVAQISTGLAFSGAIKNDGTVWTWGSGISGKLGYSASSVTVPTLVGRIYDVISLSLGYDHMLALRADGTVWGWGRNNEGQLGNGNTSSTNNPVQVSGLSEIVWVEAGHYHSFALHRDGTLYAWGRNTYGQLGNGITNNSNVPVAITPSVWNGHAIHTMAGGNEHSLGIIDYFGVPIFSAWGRNNYAQLSMPKNAPAATFIPLIVDMPIDTDGDGLTDSQELHYGTNPRNLDSNGDGLIDSIAIQLGIDPNNADTDGDGIPNHIEILLGTNPLLADTDGDGVVDGDDDYPLDPDHSSFGSHPNTYIAPHVELWKPADAQEL